MPRINCCYLIPLGVINTQNPTGVRSGAIRNPPAVLYALGDTSLLNHKIVAIAGSRNVSELGATYARSVAKYFAKKGFVVATGLAIGVDTIATKTALRYGAKVIAVLPGSVDYVVPRSNRGLAREIVRRGGLLILEYDCKDVKKSNFVLRNRIVSGIADVVVIVEAKERSGTMHTANFAREQGKPILVADVPVSGNQRLIREGYRRIRLRR